MIHQDLFDKYINDELTPEEENELAKLLENSEVADELANYIIETNMMVNAALNVEAETKQTSVKKFNYLYLLAAAAAIIVGFILFSRPSSAKFEIVMSSVSEFSKGTSLSTGRYSFAEGRLTLKSPGGDSITFKGPADFKLENANKMSLMDGRLLVKLAPKTEDFTVQTPYGAVKDLGTSFGLITLQKSCEVHVYEGRVLLTTALNRRELSKGNSCRFSEDGDILEIDQTEDVLKDNSPKIILLGDRKLKPGEKMELVLDSNSQNISGEVSLKFESESKLKYKLIGYSKGEKVFESETHQAGDKYSINIPTGQLKDLSVEMKVEKGHVINGVLSINDLKMTSGGTRPYEGETLIASNSIWHYMFETDPPANWLETDFDFSKWKSAETTIGYGDKDLKTKIGPDSLKKTVHRIYFRKNFEITDLEINSLKKININLLADDGALIYLNGKEIVRFNLPEGEINSSTRALTTAVLSSGETIYSNFTVPVKNLKMGNNSLSVILIQRKGRSSDMRFDLQMNVF